MRIALETLIPTMWKPTQNPENDWRLPFDRLMALGFIDGLIADCNIQISRKLVNQNFQEELFDPKGGIQEPAS